MEIIRKWVLFLLFCCSIVSCTQGQKNNVPVKINSVESNIVSPEDIYTNEKVGVDLLTSLPKHIQENIKYKTGSKPYFIDEEMIAFEGQVADKKVLGLNGKVKSINTYTIKNPLMQDTINYSIIKDNKNGCYRDRVEFDINGKPKRISGINYIFENGKIKSAAGQKYTYTENKLIVNHTSKDGKRKFEKMYKKEGNRLLHYALQNDEPTENKTTSVYNDKGQKIKYSNVRKAWQVNANFTYDENGRVTSREGHEQFFEKDNTTVRKEDKYIAEYKYDEHGLVVWEGFTSTLIDEQITNDGRYYHFFKDDAGLLNIEILECPPDKCPKGMMEHYIFDKHYNVIYYSLRSLNTGKYPIAYFKEFEYYN